MLVLSLFSSFLGSLPSPVLQFEGVNVSHVESIIAASPVVEVNKEVRWDAIRAYRYLPLSF